MMLDHVHQAGAAARVRAAVRRVLSLRALRTPDLGGDATTRDVGEAVCKALDDPPSP
jgi:tartrate dehydrogenase/decarboxylase/D-malate dehydrogenase